MAYDRADFLYDRTSDIYMDYQRYLSATRMLYMHFHTSFEMYVLLEGKKCYYLNNEEILLEAPAVFLIHPTILHRAYSIDDMPQERMIINFRRNLMQRWSDVLDRTFLTWESPALLFRPGMDFCDRLVNDLMRISKEENSLKYVRAAGRIFDAVCELSSMEPTVSVKMGHNAADERRVVDILTYMQNNLRENLSLGEIADHFSCTDEGLTRLLKHFTGFTYREHMTNMRNEVAVNMLANTSVSMEKIASECGYSCSNYFGDSMKKQFGIPPTEMRKIFYRMIEKEQREINWEDLLRKLQERDIPHGL